MKPILNLNKHPKDCENLSLINANNVRLSNDNTCLQSENSIIQNDTINNFIKDTCIYPYKIVEIIECNTELVIITDLITFTPTYPKKAKIFRYNERTDEIKLVYDNFNYYNGDIKGTFTYNVNGELILAIAEYNAVQDVPLRTINLGKFEEDKEQLPNELLSVNPEVIIPTLDYEYISGNMPKGWYYIFIRYKIDDNDYTQWFDVSNKILIDNIERQNIFKYYGWKRINDVESTFGSGACDYFNTSKTISNQTLNLKITNLDNRYKNYQISFICTSVDSTISYKTFDIPINISEYVLEINNMEVEDYQNLVIDNYNFYNVNNIINYQNRLYITNYNENNINEYDTSNIRLTLNVENLQFNDLGIVSYEADDDVIFNYKELLTSNIDNENIGTFEPKLNKDLNINGELPNSIFSSDIDLLDINTEYELYFSFNGFNENTGAQTFSLTKQLFIKSSGTSSAYKNIELKVNYDLYDSINNLFVFKYIDENNNEYKTIARITGHNISSYPNVILFKIIKRGITTSILNESTENIVTEIKNGNYYINTEKSFNLRKKYNTLIPGEVYNFFIHFVDKYGFYTKGFQINNNTNIIDVNSNTNNCVIIPLYDEYYKYIAMPSNELVFDDYGNIKIPNEKVITKIYEIRKEIFNNNVNYVTFGSSVVGDSIEEIKLILTNLYSNLKNIKNLKWCNIPNVTSLNAVEYIITETDDTDNYPSGTIKTPTGNIEKLFISVTNDKNERLHKTPYSYIKLQNDNQGVLGYNAEILTINVNGVIIPDGYIGYFISYEELEIESKSTGILTKYDNYSYIDANGETYNPENFIDYNNKESNSMRFFTSDYDVEDSIDLNYNILRIESLNPIAENKNLIKLKNSKVDNFFNLCTPEILQTNNVLKCYNIDKYSISIGGDTNLNRFGLGTCLNIPIIEELFKDGEGNPINHQYKASLLKINTNHYNSKDKKLIKCTNIIYGNSKNIKLSLGGYITYNNFITYNHNKFLYNTANNLIYNDNEGIYYDTYSDEDMKPSLYIQLPVYKQYLYETKEFNNAPQQVTFLLERITNSTEQEYNWKDTLGCIVLPQNSIDLFKNKYSYPDKFNPKTYQNNRTDITYLTEYNKFIRRSDVIKDESLSNSWRKFGLENYKVISENKGNITNLIGIGTYLLVHTEHSIFLFNNDNVLKTEDRNVQLEMPDIFTMDYKELVTSELGYCGLQDDKAFVLGQFGYIFYDNDEQRIYRFDAGQINTIDDNIIQFLKKYKPTKVRFAHDKESNRILINLGFNDINNENNKTLSFNYNSNSFISFHDFKFKFGYNTKNKLYLYNVDEGNIIYNFDYNNIANIPYKDNCQLDIIINEQYNFIKQLEYIIYKLYKIKTNNEDYISSPVEEARIPYSGERIRVYNNEVDTGWLDIKIDTEEAKNVFSNYEKPNWDLGNWNFSYLRNKLSDKLGSDFMSRLYGNYFIVSIIFGDSNERVEFESLGYNITKDKRI